MITLTVLLSWILTIRPPAYIIVTWGLVVLTLVVNINDITTLINVKSSIAGALNEGSSWSSSTVDFSTSTIDKLLLALVFPLLLSLQSLKRTFLALWLREDGPIKIVLL